MRSRIVLGYVLFPRLYKVAHAFSGVFVRDLGGHDGVT